MRQDTFGGAALQSLRGMALQPGASGSSHDDRSGAQPAQAHNSMAPELQRCMYCDGLLAFQTAPRTFSLHTDKCRYLAGEQALQAVSLPLCKQGAPFRNAWQCGACQSQSVAGYSAAEQRAADRLKLACSANCALY